MSLGYSVDEARMRAEDSLTMPAEYHSNECHKGGKLDLGLRGGDIYFQDPTVALAPQPARSTQTE